jgi:signal peptidase I
VPEGRLWVMGDHRSASADSKAHIDDKYSGTVGVDDVIGKASVIVWPVSRIGLLDDPDIQGVDAAGLPVGGPLGAPAAAGLVTPGAAGAVLTVPIALRRRRRR